jgi:hypothetical protein
MALCIKVAKSTGPCTLCDGPAEPTGGLAVYLEGTGQQVCRECAATVAPQLVAVLPTVAPPKKATPRKRIGQPLANGQHLSDSQRAMIAAKMATGRK